jgi:hypothetical protein
LGSPGRSWAHFPRRRQWLWYKAWQWENGHHWAHLQKKKKKKKVLKKTKSETKPNRNLRRTYGPRRGQCPGGKDRPSGLPPRSSASERQTCS